MTATSARSAQSLRALIRRTAKRASDRAFGALLRLPGPARRYTVSRVRVPMRDGVELLADHYEPISAPQTAAAPAGTLLIRGPYGRGFPFSMVFARAYAARGYHVVLQSVRGTFGSGGVFQPMVHEATDGADTVEWLRRQPWFTGRFATIGLSYLGFTQWALLQDPPPELAAAVVAVGPHDFSASSWGTGAFALNDFLGWSDLVAHQEDPALRMLIRSAGAQRRLARATRELPLGAAGRALLGRGASWYESWLEHPDREDPFWTPLRVGDALHRVQVPVLLLGGWQDLFLEQTLEQYRRLRGRGVQAALTVGPWTHRQVLTKGLGITTRETLDWLDTHLGGARATRRSAARVFVTGHGWLELPDWPPPTTPRALYLQPGGALAEDAAPLSAPPASFRFDPAAPTPTVGGQLLSPSAGYRDDSRLAGRDDVLSFDSDVLTEDLVVLGNPAVELTHTSEHPFVDVFVRVSEVDARGRSRNVSDGYRRLRDGTGQLRIQLDAVAHRFAAGARIRLLVAGGCHPRFARNLGTDEPPVTGVRMRPATHTVHFGSSRLLLPAGSADGVADPGGDAV